MIRRLAAHPLKEARTLSQALFETVHPIAPSLIRYTKPTDYDVAYHDLPEIKGAPSSDFKAVELIWFTPEADTRLVAALLYRSGGGKGFDECLLEAKQLPKERKREIVKESLRHLQPYDQVRREFEIVDLVYDLTVSATCFAQLKRHRMATILAQAYNPDLGITIPPRMLRAGLAEDFKKLIETTNESYRRLIREVPPAAPYILTNAHRRKLVLKVNARELYHISRLRLDRHAQWDIRSIVQEMVHEAQRVMPLTLLLAGGRNTYEENYQTIFSPKEEKSQ
jgi:thymidylate synthase ThyX